MNTYIDVYELCNTFHIFMLGGAFAMLAQLLVLKRSDLLVNNGESQDGVTKLKRFDMRRFTPLARKNLKACGLFLVASLVYGVLMYLPL